MGLVVRGVQPLQPAKIDLAAAPSQPDAVLVTADERYFGKAAALGRIVRLGDWPAWFAGR